MRENAHDYSQGYVQRVIWLNNRINNLLDMAGECQLLGDNISVWFVHNSE